ncbi:MAG: DeoR/GlpR transcriptional regulator [Verrucomicrobia bacterium]|nr:DeoR/GlpR transcriptional regulator [Verrucomicrobiota bacterium]
MTAEERQHRIEAHVQKVEFASLEELSRQVGASVSTIRRDLNILEAAGTIRRTHGGARLTIPKTDEFAFSARDAHQLDEKEAIGKLCASLIQPNQTVVLDGGTTVFHVAKHLQEKRLQIVTNSLPVANLFASAQHAEVILTGGVIYPRLGVLVGPLAVKTFKEIHADVAILSAGGITLDGLTNSHALLIDIQRAMMDSAGRVVFCLDHTKWDRKSVAFLCDLDGLDAIVTDSAAPPAVVESFRDRGLEVLVVGEPVIDRKPDLGMGKSPSLLEAAVPVYEETPPRVSATGPIAAEPAYVESPTTVNVATWD